MPCRLAYLTLLVPSYGEAVRFFKTIGFEVREDKAISAKKRRIRVALPGTETEIILALAAPDQRHLIGKQGAGRVWLFLETENFDADLNMLANGGAILDGAPRDISFGRIAIWRDPWGNRWGLVDHTYSERAEAEEEEDKIRALVAKSVHAEINDDTNAVSNH